MSNKKGLIAIIILSFSVLFSLFYVNYFSNSIYVKEFTETEKVEVLSKYNNKETICYGNALKCKKIKYKVKGTVNTKKIGEYDLTYTASYKKMNFKVKKKVKVVDTKKPILTVDGSFTNVCKNGKNNDVTLKAEDNYDGDITSNIKYNLNGNKITYSVKDSSGNETKKTYKVVINDNEKPNIVLNGDATMYLGVGSKYKEQGAVSIDNCDGDVSDKIIIEGKVDTSKQGTYEVKYTSIDELGNSNTVKRIVKVFPRNQYNPSDIGSKVIYLTFDDGPGPYTARLLDILATYNVKATFFVTGYNNNYNDLLNREVNEGHTLALHSYTHNYSYIYSSPESYMEDLLAIQDKVKQNTGIESKIIRFPGGSSNTVSRKYRVGIMSELTNKVEELGFRYFDWTIASGDAGDTTSSDRIVQNVTGLVGEGKLNVVLMHDIKSYTVDSIERIIQFGLSNGYTFAPITMDSPVCHQKVNN